VQAEDIITVETMCTSGKVFI